MESIIDVYENNSNISEDDIGRQELLWDPKLERILKVWKDECLYKSKEHVIRSKRNKCRYAIFSIPSILIPMIVTGVGRVLDNDSIVTITLMLTSSIFGGLNTFFNFGKKETLHNEFCNKFLELSDTINVEINKPKRNRIAADVFLEKIKQEYHKLSAAAPNL